jgi:hypothetical protein
MKGQVVTDSSERVSLFALKNELGVGERAAARDPDGRDGARRDLCDPQLTSMAEQRQKIRERADRAQESSCWRLADDVLALLDALDEAEKREAVLRDLLGPDYHVYEQREDG